MGVKICWYDVGDETDAIIVQEYLMHHVLLVGLVLSSDGKISRLLKFSAAFQENAWLPQVFVGVHSVC